MPNQRSKGQKLLNFPVTEEFEKKINEGAERMVLDRSKFIREAIVEKLRSLGIEVPREVYASPPRMGKGGRKAPAAVSSDKSRPDNLSSAKLELQGPALKNSLAKKPAISKPSGRRSGQAPGVEKR